MRLKQWFKNFCNQVEKYYQEAKERDASFQSLFSEPVLITQYEMVKYFHENGGVMGKETPCIPPKPEVDLAITLIEEEFKELKDALAAGDLAEVVDGLGDLAVVVNRAGYVCGIDMDELALEIQHSNMSKFCDTLEEAQTKSDDYERAGIETSVIKNMYGKYIIYRDDGKILKGPHFQEPDIKKFLADRGVFVNGN